MHLAYKEPCAARVLLLQVALRIERCCMWHRKNHARLVFSTHDTMRGSGSEPPRPCAASVLGPVSLAMLRLLQEIHTKALKLIERCCIWLKNNNARLEFCTPKTMRGLSPGLIWLCDVETVKRKLKEEPTSRPFIITTVTGKANQGTAIH